MSNRDRFSSGFWLGTLVGGVVGGIVGATIATQRANRFEEAPDSDSLAGDSGEKRPLKSSRMRFGGADGTRTMDRMEVARRSLDDKIGDLNNAIDAVRASIGHVPGDTVDILVDRAESELKSQHSATE